MIKLIRRLWRKRQKPEIVISAPHYVGSHEDLRRAIVDLQRSGRLTKL